jgi:hypothetical protein
MQTPDLFPPFQKHSKTSLAAAVEVKPKTETLRQQVLAYIIRVGGATDLEIQEGLKIEGSTQRPRRVELMNLGTIKDSGKVRLTKSRRKAVVWIATDHS